MAMPLWNGLRYSREHIPAARPVNGGPVNGEPVSGEQEQDMIANGKTAQVLPMGTHVGTVCRTMAGRGNDRRASPTALVQEREHAW